MNANDLDSVSRGHVKMKAENLTSQCCSMASVCTHITQRMLIQFLNNFNVSSLCYSPSLGDSVSHRYSSVSLSNRRFQLLPSHYS